MKNWLYSGLALLFALLASGCDSSSSTTTVQPQGNSVQLQATGNIVQTLVDEGSFTILANAFTATGLDAELGDESRQFTFFAPPDQAFSGMGQSTIDSLFSDPATLRNIVQYHTISDQAVSSRMAGSLAGQSVTAANNVPLQVTLADNQLYMNDAQVIVPDVPATNGVIHVVNRVLLPDANGNGGVNPGPVSQNDNSGGSNTGSNNNSGTTGGSGSNGSSFGNTVMDVVRNRDDLDTLQLALQTAGLESTLADSSKTFTLFAPSDNAFELLGQSNLDNLLADTDKLRNTLRYHLIDGRQLDAAEARRLAGSSFGGTSIQMANGKSAWLGVYSGSLNINFAKVSVTDITTANGIVHVIDAVLYTYSNSYFNF